MRKIALALVFCVLCSLAFSLSAAEWVLPASTIQIADEAFMGVGKLGDMLRIPNGTVSIGSRAFYGAGIHAAQLPASVMQIGTNAFAGNARLIWVRVENPQAQIAYRGLDDVPVVIAPDASGFVSSLDTSYTYFCPSEQLVEQDGFYYRLPGDGTAILVCPVDAAKVPTSITLPETVNGAVLTDMTRHAFHGCSQLREIHVSSTQTVVRNQALYECSRATVYRPHVDEIKLISMPERIDLYRNGGSGAYDLPKAKVQLLNGAEIENIYAEGLEELGGMMISLGELDANGSVDVGLYGSYSPAADEKSALAANHTVSLTLFTAHDELTLDLPYCLHTERVRTVHYSWDTSFMQNTYQPGDIFTIPKPEMYALAFATDRDWEFTLTIADPGIVELISENQAGYTLQAVAEGTTGINLSWRKHLTNIGDEVGWNTSVSTVTTGEELRDGWEFSNISSTLCIPLFADGTFEGKFSVAYDALSTANQSAAAVIQATLDHPGLAHACTVEMDSEWDSVAYLHFSIGPAVESGQTILHLSLQKGTAVWSKDIRIITYAQRQRSHLDYNLELPAVIYRGDSFLPKLTGRDADVLDCAWTIPEQDWDDDHTVRLPAGYYPIEWRASLKELNYPLYNMSRYVDDLAQGRTLSSDPLTSWYTVQSVIEVRDRTQPEAETPLLTAWQAKWPSSPYSADIEKMEAQDPNWPWAEYPVTGYVKLPAKVNGVDVVPTITATIKDTGNFPFLMDMNSYASTNLYTTYSYTVDSYTNGFDWESVENLWAFTQQLLIDNRQNVPAGTYTCTMQIDVHYADQTLSTDVPMKIVVVKEAADIISAMPQIPTVAKVGDTIEALRQVEYVASAVDDIYLTIEYSDPMVIDWQGNCVHEGIAHWYVWAQYRNGEVRITEGDIAVTE